MYIKFKNHEGIISFILAFIFLLSSTLSGLSLNFYAASVTHWVSAGKHRIPVDPTDDAVGQTPMDKYPGAMELPAVKMTRTYDVSANEHWEVVSTLNGEVMRRFSEMTNRDAREVGDESVTAYLFAHLYFDRTNISQLVGGTQAASYFDNRMDILKGFVAVAPSKFGADIMGTCQDGMTTAQVNYYDRASKYLPEGLNPELRIHYTRQEPIVESTYYLYGPISFETHAVYDPTFEKCKFEVNVENKIVNDKGGSNGGGVYLSDRQGRVIQDEFVNFDTAYYIKVDKSVGRVEASVKATAVVLKPDIFLLRGQANTSNYWVAPCYSSVEISSSTEITDLGKTAVIRVHRLDELMNYVKGDSIVTYNRQAGGTADVELTNGYAQIDDLPLGTYTFTETISPDGYNPAPSVTVNLIASDTVVDVYLEGAKYLVEQQVIVQTDDGKTLSNIRIDVYKGETLFDTRWTDENGIATFKLPFGEYTCRQITTHEGYVPDFKQYPISIKDNNKKAPIIIINKVIKGTIKIINTDNEGNHLYGSIFNLYQIQKDGSLLFKDKLEVHLNSENLFLNVPYGEYVVTQAAPPEDYNETAGRQTVSIKMDNTNKQLTFINNRKKGQIVISVIDENGKPVRGANLTVFEIISDVINETVKERFTVTTDVNGEVTVPFIDINKYKIRLNYAPPQYTLGSNSEDFEKVVILTPDNLNITVQFKVKTTLGSIQIYVEDTDTGDLIPSAQYELKGKDTGLIRTFQTNGTEPILLSDLPYGEYTITQKVAAPGYFIDKTIYTAVISQDGTIVKVFIQLGKYTGSVRIIVKDDLNNFVPNAAFKLMKDDDKTYVGGGDGLIKRTNTVGEAIFSGLQQGTYSVIQVETPSGWYKSNIVGKGYITKAGDISTVEMWNLRVKGNITIMKVDSITREPIQNAVMGLFVHDTDMLYSYAISNSQGKAIFKDIPSGEYYIWEIKPAFGYLHNNAIIGDETKCQIKHEPKGYSNIVFFPNNNKAITQSQQKNGISIVKAFRDMFTPVNFYAITIDENNTDITINADGTISNNNNSNNDNQNNNSNNNDNQNNNSNNNDNQNDNSNNNNNQNNNSNNNNNNSDNNNQGDDFISEGIKAKANIAVTVKKDNQNFDNVNVRIKDSQGTPTVKSAPNGYTIFYDLPFGTYYIDLFDTVSGYNIPQTQTVVIDKENKTYNIDIVLNKLAKSSIEVVVDSDGDLKLENIKVLLLDSNKERLEITKTDNKGKAYFENLEADTFYIEVKDTIDGFKLNENERKKVVLDEDRQKKVTFSYSKIDEFSYTSNSNIGNTTNINGSSNMGTITGRIWTDLNKNGKFDSNEIPIANKKIELKSSDRIVTSVVTDTNGIYKMTAIAGDYSLIVNLEEKEGVVFGTGNSLDLNTSNLSTIGTGSVSLANGDTITLSGGIIEKEFIPLPPTGDNTFRLITLIFVFMLSIFGFTISLMWFLSNYIRHKTHIKI